MIYRTLGKVPISESAVLYVFLSVPELNQASSNESLIGPSNMICRIICLKFFMLGLPLRFALESLSARSKDGFYLVHNPQDRNIYSCLHPGNLIDTDSLLSLIHI